VFNVGDRVERIGNAVPSYMQYGQVIRVIPNKDGMDWLNEYEINFGFQVFATLPETQLRLFKPRPGVDSGSAIKTPPNPSRKP
jgi:hypothetical protein